MALDMSRDVPPRNVEYSRLSDISSSVSAEGSGGAGVAEGDTSGAAVFAISAVFHPPHPMSIDTSNIGMTRQKTVFHLINYPSFPNTILYIKDILYYRYCQLPYRQIVC